MLLAHAKHRRKSWLSSVMSNESDSFEDEFETDITADQLLRADESGASSEEEEVRPNKGGRPAKPKRSGRPKNKPPPKFSREAELALSLAEAEQRFRFAQQAFIKKSLECEGATAAALSCSRESHCRKRSVR
eukprot:PhM_4_TR13326/c1_g3_i1/m.72717